MRMHTDRAIDVLVGFRARPHAVESAQLGADGQQRAHTGIARPGQCSRQIGGHRLVVEMAVAVDEKGHPFPPLATFAGGVAPSSRKRGKMPAGAGKATPGCNGLPSAAKSRASAGTASWSSNFA